MVLSHRGSHPNLDLFLCKVVNVCAKPTLICPAFATGDFFSSLGPVHVYCCLQTFTGWRNP